MPCLRSHSLLLLLVFLGACQSSNTSSQVRLFDSYRSAAIADLQPRLSQPLVPDSQHTTSLPSGSDNVTPDVTRLELDSMDMLHRVALEHSPYIATILIQLGIHEAESVQRRLAANPELGLSFMRPENGGRWQLEASLSLGLLDWLGRQRRVALADAEKMQWQMLAWQQLNQEFHQLRTQWFDAISAQQTADIYHDMLESANVSAEFSQLLFDAGNISELDLLASQSVADQRQAQARQAELSATRALLQLSARLGIADSQAIRLPAQLPQPALTSALTPEDTTRLWQTIVEHQPALMLAQAEYQQQLAALALARRQQQLRDAGIEITTERESSGEHQHGLGLSLSLPVFDSGDTRISMLEGQLLKSEQQQRVITRELNAQMHTAAAQFNTSLQQLQTLENHEMPRLRQMMALGVREYNFMLRGTFELLSIADLILDARLRQLETHQQYWLAVSELETLSGQPLSHTPAVPQIGNPD